MTLVMENMSATLQRWQGPGVIEAVAELVGEIPNRVLLERTHFPAKRPVQANFVAQLRSGVEVAILAEFCPKDPQAHRRDVLASLRKSRHGQKAGLSMPAMVVAEDAGLVMRRQGLDERLPGLRLLYDPSFAQEAVAQATGHDPGEVSVTLVAHRLGKRAVLRIASDTQEIYARLRPIKSGDGAQRLARHRALYAALGDRAGLRIPEPLGALPEIGLALFGKLPGIAADFGPSHSAAIARAVGALQALDPEGLPVHTSADEIRILSEWFDRCRLWRPNIAKQLKPGLSKTIDSLSIANMAPHPCHRDLHEKQILIAGDTAGLLDFDTLCLSDPRLDTGNLLAHLFMAGEDETPLRKELDRPGVDLWRKAALLRLAMIYSVTSTPDQELQYLIEEATRHA